MKKLDLRNSAYTNLLAQFSSHLLALNYSKSTIYNTQNALKEYLHYLVEQDLELQKTTKHDLVVYFEKLAKRSNNRREGALSLGYLHKHRQSLQLLYLYLHITSLRSDIPKLPRLPKVQREAKALTVAQVQSLFKSCDQSLLGKRNKAILALYYGCGLRRKEGVSLNVEDVDLERSEILIKDSKTKKQRYVPMNEATQKLLEDYLFNVRELLISQDKTEAGFLVSERGKRLSPTTVDYTLKQLVKNTKDEVLKKELTGLHLLRHSIATHLLQAGMKLENIALFLGHKSLNSTQIYTHLNQKS